MFDKEINNLDLAKVDNMNLLKNPEFRRFLVRLLKSLQINNQFTHLEALALRNFSLELVNELKDLDAKNMAEIILASNNIFLEGEKNA